MSKITAQIVADSKNEFGDRITTFVVTFPRIILAEFNTHRMFSRNSASSRAIPFEKMVKSVEENPFVPIAWQKDHKGMQGSEYFEGWRAKVLELAWIGASKAAVWSAKKLNKLGLTKQLCNRILEPFMYHTVICTATEWENFFHLRCPRYVMRYMSNERIIHEDVYRSKKDFIKGEELTYTGDINWLAQNKGQAEIHIMALSELMWDAYNESTPKQLKAGEWHIPFGDNINLPPTIPIDEGLTLDEGVARRKIKIAVARCARISYTVVGEERINNIDNDIKLHDILLTNGHLSPTEHIGMAMDENDYENSSYNADDGAEGSKGWSGNFKGFVQYRKLVE